MPQTGLGILMNNNKNGQANGGPLTYSAASMTPEQKKLVQEDMADRERQASALAAAGRVAETVQHSNSALGHPLPNGSQMDVALAHQGLNAPPLLGSIGPPPNPEIATSAPIEGVNWGSELSPDDMDMDFAKLFDPAHEQANMQAHGNGWPILRGGETKTADPPIPTKPPGAT